MTIAAVFAAVAAISVSAVEFLAGSGLPAVAFPKPDRPVANIVSSHWHDEKERDDAGEPTHLGIKSGMTIADIGAGNGYYVVAKFRYTPRKNPTSLFGLGCKRIDPRSHQGRSSVVFDLSRRINWPAGYTGRLIRNQHAEISLGREHELEARIGEVSRDYASARQRGDFDITGVIAGEACALIHDIPPAAEIVERIVSEAERLLRMHQPS